MQQLSGKIESRTERNLASSPFLINTNFSEEISVTNTTISKICSFEGCRTKGRMRKDMCDLHYKRLWRHGDASIVFYNKGKGDTQVERFWSRVDKTPGLGPDGDCWEWRGKISHQFGYGKVKINGQDELTHRAAWILTYGQPKLFILHSCDNPPCVNPDHLREGTKKDNSQDALSRDRLPLGSKRVNALINEDIARQIKTLRRDGSQLKEIVQTLGISKNIVVNVVYEHSWRHVKI